MFLNLAYHKICRICLGYLKKLVSIYASKLVFLKFALGS